MENQIKYLENMIFTCIKKGIDSTDLEALLIILIKISGLAV